VFGSLKKINFAPFRRDERDRVIYWPSAAVKICMIKKRHFFAAISAFLVSACATAPQPVLSERGHQSFILEKALIGKLVGHGTITPIVGSETEFNVSIEGSQNGEAITLVEDFKYPTGTSERKTWHLTHVGEGLYTGTREDVLGLAQIRQDGLNVRMDYNVMLDTPLGKLQTRFQDVLFLMDENSIHNRATASKLGVRLARVDLILNRVPDDPERK
jgi:hypothetical protein